MSMRVFLRVLVAAVVGGSVSSYAKQYVVQRNTDEPQELVFEPATTPIVVGTLAGLVAPRQYRLIAAVVVSALSGLIGRDPIEELVADLSDES